MIDFEKLADIYTRSVVHSVWAKQPSQLVLSLRKIFPWLAQFDIIPDGPLRYRAVGGGDGDRVMSRIHQAEGLLEEWVFNYAKENLGSGEGDSR